MARARAAHRRRRHHSFIHPRLFDFALLTPYISFATVGREPGGYRLGLTITNQLKRPEPQALAGAVAALAARFGNRLITSPAVREQHAPNTPSLPSQAADAAVR